MVTANNLLHQRRASVNRAHKLLAKIPPPQAAADHFIDISDHTEDDYHLALIAAVLSRLSRRDRDIVQLCVVEGLTPTEVASASGEPAGSIRSRLSRALVGARREFHALNTDATRLTPSRTTP